MQPQLSRITCRIVSLAQKAVVGDADVAFRPDCGGWADWVIVTLQGLRKYLYFTYRMLLDVLREMPDVVDKLGLAVDEVPDFTMRAVATVEDADLARLTPYFV